MNKKILIIIVVLISLSLVIFLFQYFFNAKPNIINVKTSQDASKDVVSDESNNTSNSIFKESDNFIIKNILGEVSQVASDRISINILPDLALPTDENLTTRIVEIDINTKIYQLIQKDVTQYQLEIKVFQEAVKKQNETKASSSEPIFPPEIYNKNSNLVNLSEIKTGVQVEVIANENIRSVKKFKASEIKIYPSINAPATTITK